MNTGVVYSYAHATRAGKIPNKVKPNQDSYITYANLTGQPDRFIFGVCDGHGPQGHLVSGFIKENLPKSLEIEYKGDKKPSSPNMHDLIKRSFALTNTDLNNSSHMNLNFSGSTTVTVIILNNKLWCANLGDSRAIMARCNKNGTWKAHALSNDHKPRSPGEYERIIKTGGRVEPFKSPTGEFLGPDRVWLKNESIPGLAMSRSFGDLIAKKAGVIAEPEIIQTDIKDDDQFIVIGSDGLFEFLANEKIMNLVVPYFLRNELKEACDVLVKAAVQSWKDVSEMIDDITCVIVSLKK